MDNNEEKKEGKKLIMETNVVEYTVSRGFRVIAYLREEPG